MAKTTFSDGNPTSTPAVKGTKVTAEFLNWIQRQIVPEGAVAYFARATPPEGWLVADGTAVSRSAYPELFTAIGTLFGNGNGSTTFNLPDLRGEFIRGVDSGRGADPSRALGSWQVATAFMGDGDGINLPFPNLNNATHKSVLGFDLDAAPENTVPVTLPITYAYKLAEHDQGPYTPTGMHTVGGASIAVDFARTRPRNVALLACIKC